MGNDSSFIDELLNFSAPEKEQLEKEDLQTPRSSSHRETEVRQTDSSGLINFDDDEVGEEEDLEWMTNRDAFPMIPLEHLGVLTEQFNLFPSEQFNETSLTEEKQLSPISVLETSSSSHGSTTTNTISNSSVPSTTAMATTTSLMNYCVGFKAPSKERSKRLRRGRSDMQVLWTSNGNEQGGGIEKKMKTSSVVAPAVIIGRKCQHCGTEKTPQWRAGPLGAKTLCNACGVRYKSGRLYPEYRPVNSPSFTPELHSNSHRRVVEMRKKFQSGDSDRKNCE